MRMIDADALKKSWSMGDNCEDCPQNVRVCQYVQDFSRMDICEMLDEAPTVGGWISVKDRLPETNDEVLTTYLYDDKPHKLYVETASYFDDGEGEGHWHSVWDEFSIGRVRKTTIAWMPMPKPYKPQKEENDEAD